MTWQYGGTVTLSHHILWKERSTWEDNLEKSSRLAWELLWSLDNGVLLQHARCCWSCSLHHLGLPKPRLGSAECKRSCRMFLQELGHTLTDEHLTACMQNPSTYSLVWSFHFEYLESSMQDKPKGPHMVHLPERDAKYIILTGNSRCICRVLQKCLHKPCNPQCESSVAKAQMIRVLIWVT